MKSRWCCAYAACLLIGLAAPPVAAQRIELTDAARLPRFEVASVRRSDPNAGPARFDAPPGRYVQENAPLLNAISLAFDLRSYQFAGPLPALTRELFTIDARMPVASTAAELKLMLRSLLIDRFKLRVHVESREQDAYALTLARRDGRIGPQLQQSRVDCPARMEAQRRNEPLPPQPEGSKPCTFNYAPGRIDLGGTPLSALGQLLAGQVGRPVVDRTGLTGRFDVELQWSVATAAALGAGGNTAGSDAPSIFTAVQEQIGLKLEPAKTSVDYLVIDHIEPPEAN
jgi:uncharacterized protein (TIGR03435 family)